MWLRIALLALLSWTAMADEIRLNNGDRISGEVKARAGDRLVVQTEYAGEISVRLGDIHSVSIVDLLGEVYEIGPLQLDTLDPGVYKSRREVAYAGRALVSVAYSRGNTDSDQLHLDGDFTARAREYRYSLSGRVDRRSEPPAETSTAWLGSANYDRFLSERRFVYVRGSLEHDRAKDIDRRASLGAGYGVQLLEEPAANLSVRAGLDHVVVERIVGPREEYPAFGWGVTAAFSPFGPRLQLFHEHEGFWNLEETDVVVVRSKTGLRVPLIERLNATAQLNVDWERQPAAGRRSTDSTLLLGVDYAF
jgi:putative salt-induced outer membrane protein YdiY